MKQRLLKRMWTALCMGMAAVAMTTIMTGCSDDDNDAASNPDLIEDFEDPAAAPTVDALTVPIKGETYVFEGNYSGDGKALADRVQKRAAYLASDANKPNEDVENIIVHNDRIVKLNNAEASAMIMVLAKGGSISIADPTIDNLKVLVQRLRSVISQYQPGGGGNNISAKYVARMLNMDAINRIVMWTDNFDFSVYLNAEGRGDYMSLIIFRDEDSYISYRDTETLTAYQHGQKADRAAMWININTRLSDDFQSRMYAARMMAMRAGGDAEQYVDRISKSFDVTYLVGVNMIGPWDFCRFHNCTLTYRIWTAYSKEKNCDVYCVTQTVTAFNQDLECGPKSERKWYNGEYWDPWKNLNKKTTSLQKDVFGPYMKKIYTRCELVDGTRQAHIEDYAPKNSTSGGYTETNGFTFGLGANATVTANGPQAGVSANMSWSHTVSQFNADLTMTASPSSDGVVEWTYEGNDVPSHYSKTPWKNHYHGFPRDIQVNTCTVEQAWVWTVRNSKSSTVTIKPTFQLLDDWLTYDRAWNHPLEAHAHYIHMGELRNVTPIVINCPPRYIQTWSMSVKTDAQGADVVKIKNYLTEQLSQYCLASSVFYTVRPDHKASYNEGKSIEEYDEIGQFVEVAKNAFTTNDAVKDILRDAAKVGGMPDGGSYTIVWRQTDAGINSDSEEYTVNP